MWKVAGLVNGAWDTIDVIELDPVPFTSEAVRRAVKERFPNSRLLHYFGLLSPKLPKLSCCARLL